MGMGMSGQKAGYAWPIAWHGRPTEVPSQMGCMFCTAVTIARASTPITCSWEHMLTTCVTWRRRDDRGIFVESRTAEHGLRKILSAQFAPPTCTRASSVRCMAYHKRQSPRSSAVRSGSTSHSKPVRKPAHKRVPDFMEHAVPDLNINPFAVKEARPTCKACRHYDNGICRWGPPRPMFSPQTGIALSHEVAIALWPKVSPDDWCGRLELM